MVVPKDTQTAIREAIDELRREYISRIEKVEEVNERLNSEIIDLKNKLKETETNYLSNNKPLFSSLIKKTSEGAPPISESETRVINAISAEQKEKVKKEKNVVVFGLEESNRKEKDEIRLDDDESIGKVFDAIGLDKSKIVKHFRLKRNDITKPGPLVLEISESSYQKQVLSVARDLNGIKEYKKRVFINPDLTYRERASLKLLLGERKRLNEEEENKKSSFRFVIRNDLLERIEIKHH
jgi:hypothetical protein